MPSPKLTDAQYNAASIMFDGGSYNYYLFPFAGRNKPAWRLVEMGIATFDFGPRGSWLQSYCFMPVWSDPIC